jgi:hypothetical protein
MPTPELSPQPSMILKKMMRRLTLDRLHHSARRPLRRYIQQQVYMIRTNVPLHYLYVMTPAHLLDQIPNLSTDVAT